ncbi:MAG: restriction endonuclease [Cyanobacteria bacterium REEB446]|nr:restriction endonuclease [Cyanobacteria bacterium REEB446]
MIPSYNELIHPLLKLIRENEQSRKGASEKLSLRLNLTEEDRQEKLSSGGFMFENRVGWAFTYLTKAEYIESTEQRGIYRITDLGTLALKDAEGGGFIIDRKYLEKHSANYHKNWQVIKRIEKLDEEKTDTDVFFDLEEELDRADNNFNSNLLQKIKDMTWQEFEDLCATLLEKMGYGVASKRQIRIGDGGIDGEIFEDELGLRGKIYIQAKKWDNNNIQPKDIKEFLYNVRGNKGVFITTSDFSPKSREEAKNYKDGKIALISYIDLIKLCKKYEVLCKKRTIEVFELEESNF